ncbi:MAG: hypothetical protein WBE39_02695, partial [Candidatus Competibacter sp.]
AKNSLPCGVCGVGIPRRRIAAQMANGATPHAPAFITLRTFRSLVKVVINENRDVLNLKKI